MRNPGGTSPGRRSGQVAAPLRGDEEPGAVAEEVAEEVALLPLLGAMRNMVQFASGRPGKMLLPLLGAMRNIIDEAERARQYSVLLPLLGAMRNLKLGAEILIRRMLLPLLGAMRNHVLSHGTGLIGGSCCPS